MKRSYLLLMGACLALAACGGDAPVERQPDDDRSAEGEVQGGTISDAMLPLGHVRSQSPPLREAGTATTASGGNTAAGAADAAEGAETSDAGDEVGAPAESTGDGAAVAPDPAAAEEPQL